MSANKGHSLAGSSRVGPRLIYRTATTYKKPFRRAACSTCGKESLVAVKKEKASGRWEVESGKRDEERGE